MFDVMRPLLVTTILAAAFAAGCSDSAGPPPADLPPAASCASAPLIEDGTLLLAEALDLGNELASSCTGGDWRSALYYRASVPPGQRLTARAQAVAGDRLWVPALQLLGACGQGACLTTETRSADGEQRELRYVNQGATEERVVLAVGASADVRGASFRLDVGLGLAHTNGICGGERSLSDGLVLRDQDLKEGRIADSACRPTRSPSLFYSATLLPGQNLVATATSIGPNPMPLPMVLRESCAAARCFEALNGMPLSYTNTASHTRTVVLEVTSFASSPPPAFDLQISMPLPRPPLPSRPRRACGPARPAPPQPSPSPWPPRRCNP